MAHIAQMQQRAPGIAALLAAVLAGALAGGIAVGVIAGGTVIDLAPGANAPAGAPAVTEADDQAPGVLGPAGTERYPGSRFQTQSRFQPMPE
jgi:hypothetical protein